MVSVAGHGRWFAGHGFFVGVVSQPRGHGCGGRAWSMVAGHGLQGVGVILQPRGHSFGVWAGSVFAAAQAWFQWPGPNLIS